jgi:hypothetical protein
MQRRCDAATGVVAWQVLWRGSRMAARDVCSVSAGIQHVWAALAAKSDAGRVATPPSLARSLTVHPSIAAKNQTLMALPFRITHADRLGQRHGLCNVQPNAERYSIHSG